MVSRYALLEKGLTVPPGPQDGDSPYDAEAGVEGLAGDPLPVLHLDEDPDLACGAGLLQGLLHAGLDLDPWGGVDGRLAHGDGKAGPGDPAHARAPVDQHPGRAFGGAVPHHGPNARPVGGVRVVAPVLDDLGLGLFSAK